MGRFSFASVGLIAVALVEGASGAGCSGAVGSGFGHGKGSGGSGPSGGDQGGDGGLALMGDSSQGGGSSLTTTIYANSDTALFTVDPTSKAVTLVGEFQGQGGGSGDSTVTDLAVNAEGEVYVNTETVVYKATVPATAGPVVLTRVASISTSGYQYFYALAFAPPGVLGSGETLVGGDGNGEVWSIDPTSGATQDLGSFGPVPHTSRTFGLSGDIVFYLDASNKPTGLATIRSCDSSGSCTESDDYLAGIDMTALVNAYTSHTPAASLLAGIYGGSSASVGSGTGYGKLFGLGAWGGEVYAFARAGSSGSPPPQLVLIDTTTGAGSVSSTSAGFSSGGWSGAGVSTRTSVTVPPPPPAPK